MSKTERKLSARERVVGLARVAKVTYKASPLAVYVKIIDAVIDAVLPLVTVYFAAQTTTALAAAYAGDHAAGSRAVELVIVTAVLGVVQTGWTSVSQYINNVMRYKVEVAIGDRLLDHFLALEFWQYDDKKTADVYDKARRFSSMFPYVFDSVARIVSSVITLITGLIALFIVSWWLGIILIAAVIPGIYFQFSLSRARTAYWSKNTDARRVRNWVEWLMQRMQTITELRLYGMVKHLMVLRNQARDKDERQRIEFERQYMGKQFFASALESAAEVVALVYTATQIMARTQPIGQFLYVQQVVSRALGGAQSFVTQISSIDGDLANMLDYNEFMAMPLARSRTKQLASVPTAIDVRGVSFHYPGDKRIVLSDVSLTITSGQRIAIVGENGAGKSTLIKLLLGLYRPTSGEVLADGQNLKDVTHDSWHQHIGVLQQEFVKYDFATARDNVYYGDATHPFDQARFDAALDMAEARGFLEKLPKGVDNFVDPWMEHDDKTSGVDLSGGQWQRLALARNFYRNSPIVILDEPTSAIDALAETRIFKRLFAARDRTLIMISHRLTTVEKADMIYVMHEGKLVEQGTHAELVQKHGRYYEMFESQLRP